MLFGKGMQWDLLCINRNLMNIFVGFLLFLFVVSKHGVDASIHEYKNEAFIPRFNSFFFHGGSEGLYASKILEPPKMTTNDDNAKPLNGKSFIRFESIIFRRPKEIADKQNEMQQSTGVIEAIVVEVKDRDKIGGAYMNSNAICCNPALAKDLSCKLGEVIIRQDSDNPDWPKRLQTSFQGKNEEANMILQTVEINKTGMYYLYFVFCDPELKGTLISGRTVWRNPEGYLPGKMAPLMTFYGLMSLAYLALGLLWFLRFVQHWKDIIQLHYQITAVIGLGMCEMALWYFEYANFNDSGSRPMGITLWAVTFSAIKKTVSRLLLLVVSMGYGVMRPTLGGITTKIILLGAVYFVASEALELVEHLGNINDFAGKSRLFLVLPVALLDAFFIIWIFSSLSKTLEKLQMRRSMAKLELYRKFTNALAVSVLLSVAWIGYELYFNASDPLSELWRRAWIIPAFWTLLAYLLLVVICILLAPSHNPTRYAYETGDDEEEGISLTGTGVILAGDLASKVERKDRKVSIAADHVFGLSEDLEEDKRE
ncbi:transmembrane protein 87A [Olea europaea var. sylvestris]|uniref:Transmembrane 87B-like n=1 Tax=Olea europaea subsp. europaea TaxID=158383 RepID=A0A8S0S016_OLEEU|nr:transmembrane protein 87A [Olea europaea var. sylvestris]XP_022873802.1 transmembrane protein 87A [Olea europaea var. sylvestris]CAA2985931.1 transmembrane 87B-like [Olea europaea subsp. europaea]